jgi:hypothetical protein
MDFDISGRVLRWPDGSDGTIQQEEFGPDHSVERRDAYVARLRIKRGAKPDITGGLRFTSAAHGRMPGRDDAEKAHAVALKLRAWVAQHGLADGFFFRIEAGDLGVEVFEA